ncbi:MAG: hypothetical protein HDS27_00015 [Bacteroides sp.]|nr:hypothetical protein [Bacteroides sp.]
MDRATLFEIIIIERKRGDKIADRIDIQCEIEPVAFDDMFNRAPAESSASIRERVIKARAIQTARFLPASSTVFLGPHRKVWLLFFFIPYFYFDRCSEYLIFIVTLVNVP